MRTRIRRSAAAVVTASALCLAGTACGAEDDKKPSASADKSGEKQDGASTPAVKPFTAEQLKAATLVAGDLPDGWKATKTPSSDDPAPKADKPECQPIANLLADDVEGATMGEPADFETAGSEKALSQAVFTLEGTGAADFTKALGTALDACPQLTFTQDGEKNDVKIEKVAAGKVAEDSQTFSMTMKLPGLGVDYKVYLLVASQGTAVSRAAFIPGEDPAAVKAFDGLVKVIGDKLVKAAQG
ncbi:hypothetical protein ACWD0A_32895 [Streptomyces sp. NPDC002867]